MSYIESVKYKCDHCGFECNSDEGDGDLGWFHSAENPYGVLPFDIETEDLCPNCVSELKQWLRAGPQHEDERQRLKAQESVHRTRMIERQTLMRHPAQNKLKRVLDIMDRDD